MKHYICIGGCQGVSETIGTCKAEGCPNYGKPLEECECEDGEHKRAVEDESRDGNSQ